MVYKEKSDYLRTEILSKNFFKDIKGSLEQIKKEKQFTLSIRDKIRERAEELWEKDKSRSDLDNWLLAEKQIQHEEYMKNKKLKNQQDEINRCLRKIYNLGSF